MEIASVVVDVPTRQTDRAYDYFIPMQWEGMIVPGTRVVVPFGPRKVQGFVVEIKESTSIDKLKGIDSLLDLEPVLNQELLQLADWLTTETLCLKIVAYQAMLPAALKAKYKKLLTLKGNIANINDHIRKYFIHNDAVDFEAAMEHEYAKIFQKEIIAGNIEVNYQVKDKHM